MNPRVMVYAVVAAALSLLFSMVMIVLSVRGMVVFSILAPIIVVLMLKNSREILIASIVVCILLVGLYFPLYGFATSMAVSLDTFVVKSAIGVRSVFYTSILTWLVVTVVLVRQESIRQGGAVQGVFLALYLLFILVNTNASFEPRISYAVNSIFPLYLSYFLISYRPEYDVKFPEKRLIEGLVYLFLFAMFFYSLIFPLIYDVVRPDLISFIRSSDGLPLAYGEVPDSWRSEIAGYKYTRFVGTFPDPIIFGYLLSSIAVYSYKNKMWLAVILSLVMALMAGSKGAVILFINTLALAFVLKYFFKARFAAVAGMIALQVMLSKMGSTSGYIHYLGLVGGFESLMGGTVTNILFGFGLGEGGNLARFSGEVVSVEDWLNSGSESGVGIIAYQLGGVGLFVYFSMIFKSSGVFMKKKSFGKRKDAYASALLLAVFINSFLQENAINSSVVSIVILFYILMGRGSGERSRYEIAA